MKLNSIPSAARTLAITVSAVALAAPSLFAQVQAPAAKSPAAATWYVETEAALLKASQEQELIGLAAAVVEPNGAIKTFYFGFADREAKTPVTKDTMFRWASISKPLTAIAAMQLDGAGKLDIDADIREHVPEFAKTEVPVTARLLMQHRGGIVHYTNGKVVRTRREYNVEHPFADTVLALDRFIESPLVAVPGTRHSYTTHGYMLLGAVVQRAGGAPFAAQVKERIIDPLGLVALRPDYQWEDIPHRATGYVKLGKGYRRSSNTDVSWKLPGGGYISNVEGLAGFAAGLCGEKLLPRERLDEMWTAQQAPERKTGVVDYGLGFRVNRINGRLRIGHGGAQEKTRTLMQVFPDEKTAVVLMTNSEWAVLGPIADAVWSTVRATR